MSKITLSHSFSEHLPDSLPLSARVDEVIDIAVGEQRIAGAVVLIARDGETIFARAAGFADREAARPMRIETLFRLSSISKVYVSVAAMVLVHEGKLALDAPVTTWLPAFRPPAPDGTVPDMTLRQLLSHTAGLGYGFLEAPDGPYHRAGVSDGMDASDLTLDENVRRIGTVPLLFTPGESWNYSLATDVLGAVIERATGLPLDQAVRSLVAEPLGLVDSGFSLADGDRLAAAYTSDPRGLRRMLDQEIVPLWEGVEGLRLSLGRAFEANAFHSGGAGMIGTAGDLLHLLETLRNGGAPLLPTPLLEEMAVDHATGMELAPWPGRGFGLGFSIMRDPAAAGFPEPVGTWRLGGAYGHSWSVDRTNKLTVVAFTNSGLEGQSPGGKFPADLSKAIYAGC